MRNTTILIVFLLNLDYAFSQSDSTLLSYYPLQIGNYWEYQGEIRELDDGTSEYSYFSLEVVSDTLMSNGNIYKKLVKKTIPDTSTHQFFFERQDSVSSNIYRYGFTALDGDQNDFIIDSLSLPVGDYFEGYSRDEFLGSSMDLIAATISHIDSQAATVFEILLPTKHFSANNHFTHPDTYEYWLTQGIGLTRGYKGETVWEQHLNLLYAEVEGQTYGEATWVSKEPDTLPSFELHQNYPNPFNPITTISYQLATAGDILLEIYNLRGQLISTLVNEFQTAGSHQIEWDARSLSSGVYLYKIHTGKFVSVKKGVLLK